MRHIMAGYKRTLFFGLLLYIGYHESIADDVNEDLCGKIDLDGPVQTIQNKLDSLYSGSDAETDAALMQIRSNFDDLALKADKIADECDRKTPKLLGFINQMNQAKQCIDALSNSNELEAQNECQAVHDEAKLNFIVRTIANDSKGYAEVLKVANTFTDLVQRVKMYRAILREEDKGDKESNRKFYDTVKQLLQKKNTPTNALRDILKCIAMKSVLDKDLKFTDLELMKDLHEYDEGLATTAVTELVSQVYEQNNYTANHFLYLPFIRSRVAAIIAVYNKSKDHLDDNQLSKNIYKVIYITILNPDYKMIDKSSKKQLEDIFKKLPLDDASKMSQSIICINANLNDTNTTKDAESSIMIRSVTNDGKMEEWKFMHDVKGTVLEINVDDDSNTKLFVSKDDYSSDELNSLDAEYTIGKWYKLNTVEICSIKENIIEEYICLADGTTDLNIFSDSNTKTRNKEYEERKEARKIMCINK